MYREKRVWIQNWPEDIFGTVQRSIIRGSALRDGVLDLGVVGGGNGRQIE